MGGGSNAGPSRTPTSLRVAGAWSGSMEVLLDEWSVKDLRAEVSRRSGFTLATVKLISAGKILKDHNQQPGKEDLSVTLREAGLGENSKLLVTRVGGEQASAVNQEKERSERLSRLKAAADSMAKRSNDDSSAVEDDFIIQIENQSGDELALNSADDRRALMMGLMLHAKARGLVQKAQYTEALEILSVAEEAFSLCDRKIFEAVDNAALLQLDTVWCLFMLRDISRLAVARERLLNAREGLSRSHGSNLERLRVLQGGFCPELAVYVRLELLEGVVAYHSGHPEAARQSLVSAHSKYRQLQVSDEAVAQLAAMGFAAVESRRALRMCGQDVHRAIEFTMEEKRKKQEQREKDRRVRRELREQRRFGKTPRGKVVDMTKLNELASIGYERSVAAEALRQCENDFQRALDVVSNPAAYAALQVSLEARPPRRQVDDAALTTLLSMGFDRERAIQALQRSDTSSQAIEKLLQGQFSETDDALASRQDASAASSQAPSTTESSGSGADDILFDVPEPREPRDAEMEDDIAANLTGDSLEEYDLEVDNEGEAITEYLRLLDGVPICNS
ncbi:unnamed protein product [Calypogeia fissa]